MTQTEAPPRGFVDRVKGFRERARSTATGRLVWRTGVTVLGVAIIITGIVLLPLPGPGWLIIFGGLGVLATEFEWASRLLHFARRQVGAWTQWVTRQSRPVQALIGLAGLVILAGALWLALWFYRR